MTQSAFKELDPAFDYAKQLIDSTATAQGWSAVDLATATADLDDAYAEADSYGARLATWLPTFGFAAALVDTEIEDVAQFWDLLAVAASTWTAPNADKLTAAFLSASGTVALEAEKADLEDPLTIAVDGAAATAEDLADAAQGGAELIEQHPWIPIAVAGGVILLVSMVVLRPPVVVRR